MPIGAPHLTRVLETRGFTVIPLAISQLQLSGGGVRCTTLALDAG
jgi:N-dimethylarginine dimethylaminohydrolase